MALSNKERDQIKDAMALVVRETNAGERIILKGIGTFSQVRKAARTAKNPKTGETVQVAAKTTLKFKPSEGVTVHEA